MSTLEDLSKLKYVVDEENLSKELLQGIQIWATMFEIIVWIGKILLWNFAKLHACQMEEKVKIIVALIMIDHWGDLLLLHKDQQSSLEVMLVEELRILPSHFHILTT